MTPADDPTGAAASGAQASFANAFAEPLKAAMSFGKFVPGFDFLEQWTRQAQSALPTMGQWVAPTLDPAELDKRIQDLRTVQFWLEQNARMLGMTIQALEVQRMTLATLQGMNVPVDALRESLKARPSAAAAAPAAPETRRAAGAAAQAAAPSAPLSAEPAEPPAGGDAGAPAAGPAAVDPMRWWGALTQQFTQLAAHTMQDALGRDRAAASSAGDAADQPAAAGPTGAGTSAAARTRRTEAASGDAPAASHSASSRGNEAAEAADAPDTPRTARAKARGGAADKPGRR